MRRDENSGRVPATGRSCRVPALAELLDGPDREGFRSRLGGDTVVGTIAVDGLVAPDELRLYRGVAAEASGRGTFCTSGRQARVRASRAHRNTPTSAASPPSTSNGSTAPATGSSAANATGTAKPL